MIPTPAGYDLPTLTIVGFLETFAMNVGLLFMVTVAVLAIRIYLDGHRWQDVVWYWKNPARPWPPETQQVPIPESKYSPAHKCGAWFRPAGFVELSRTPEGWKATGIDPNYRDDTGTSKSEADAC